MTRFKAQRVTRTYTQQLNAPPADVFPLICPIREEEWLAGFKAHVIYADSGLAEQDMVFTTQHPGQPETVWTITRHDPQASVVEFVRLTPGLTLDRLEVRLEDGPQAGTTQAHITYVFTALSEHGNIAIEHHHSPERFQHAMAWWERSLNHFIATGQQLAAPA